VDSIQTIYTDSLESSPGSVGQVRESAAKLIRVAKQESLPVFLVGHVTKELSLAGPKVLEHAVDAVISFEGDRHLSYRILRSVKNRFGGIELGIYDMRADGLQEVSNPSEIFLSQHDQDHSGVAITATIEGTRPLLVETQALVSPMAYSAPQRSAVGLDNKRLNILVALLERRAKVKLGNQDLFLSLTGGLRLDDPGLDLAQVVAVVSSLYDYPVPRTDVFAAEIGLSSELRPVSRPEQRIAEAEKLGFKRMFMARSQVSSLRQKPQELELVGATKLSDVFARLFGGE
jgi:DNA repair protein RadA/Sms